MTGAAREGELSRVIMGFLGRGIGAGTLVGLGGLPPMFIPAMRAASSAGPSSGTGDGPRNGSGACLPRGVLPRSRLALVRSVTGGCGRTRLEPNATRSTLLMDEIVSLRSRRAWTAALRGTEGGREIVPCRTGLIDAGKMGERAGGQGRPYGDGVGEGETLRSGGAGETLRGGGAGDTLR
jgi:hypothetical protein